MASNAPAKRQPEYTVAMFGYYVPYWLIAVIIILLLVVLHRMNAINMGCLIPTCLVPSTQKFVITPQIGGAYTDELSPAASLLPNINSS